MRHKPLTWLITILASILLIGVGMSQRPQFDTGTAEARGEEFAQLTDKFNALKAKHEKLKAIWQAELLAQFVPTLADEPSAVKGQFLDFLKELGTPSAAALTEMLNDSSERVRRKAVDVLGAIGERERKAGRSTEAIAAGLAAALRDTSEKVRSEAIEELEDVHPTSPESVAIVVPALIESLHDSSERVRQKAIEALGEIGEDMQKAGRNTDAIAIGLAAALRDSAERVRREALNELEDVRPTSTESLAVVIPALIERRTVGSSRERSELLDVLGGIGEKLAEKGQPTATIRDALIASLTDNSSKVRTNAIEELSDMHDNSAETLAALKSALTDSSKSVRRAAQKAIQEIEKANQ